MSVAAPVSRPTRPADVVALQYAVPTRTVVVPLGILVAVVVVMVAVTAIVVRGGGHGSDLEYNGAVVWSLTGFLVAVGVQGVAVSFPLALALGTTRRAFTLGTLASTVLESVMLTAAALLLLGLERLTGGWFVGARVLSDATLGGGDPVLLIAIVLVGTLTALSVGTLYGAAWVRFGPRGPMAVGGATVLVALIVLLLLLPQAIAVVTVLGWWSPLVVAAVLVVGSTAGEYLLLRRASVR